MRRTLIPLAAPALAASLAVGCAVPGADGGPPWASRASGGLPGRLTGVLTSALDRRPYTAEELALPLRRSMVEQCERAGRTYCRERLAPTDRRASFAKGADPRVVALLTLGGLEAGATYDIACGFRDPSGRVAEAARLTASLPPDAPPDATVSVPCAMALDAGAPAGVWRLELVVNGEGASGLPFEVVEAAGSGPA